MAATTVAEKIAEIERKQQFTSDWFEESLQEMAGFVKAKYDIIEKTTSPSSRSATSIAPNTKKMVKEKGEPYFKKQMYNGDGGNHKRIN